MAFLEKNIINKDGKVETKDKQPRKENQERAYNEKYQKHLHGLYNQDISNSDTSSNVCFFFNIAPSN